MSNPYPIHRIASFGLVDGAIREWCRRHSLVLSTDYKDYDVRSVDVVGPGGKSCQVWIDPPVNGTVTIHVWPYASPHERLTVGIEEISTALEQAYAMAARLVAGNQ